jgi:GTP-binding protein LepA
METNLIRNFSIIAHIDHGKSTLADRLMEITGTVDKRNMKDQLLDKMDLEREKGITIKLAPVRMEYNGHELNLIDTPGHVDFSYEVSRSLNACEGAVLVVDATQGIQAQTLANVYLAINAGLVIIPVINKIDLPAADIPKTTEEILSLLGGAKEGICLISAKSGQGVESLLEEIIKRVPPPKNTSANKTRGLIFDSYYDDYRGVILYIRIFDGRINKDDHILMMATQAHGQALEVGILKPDNTPTDKLTSGEIGYIVTNLKSTHDAKVGDTVTLASDPAAEPLPGYLEVKPFVYAGFFPTSNEHYEELKEAIEKLSLSDSSLQFSYENSPVLGFGLRIGFLGLLHMDIVRERLEREYNLELVISSPSTDYIVKLTNGTVIDIKSASEMPDASLISEIKEPWIKGEVITPSEFIGSVINLIVSKRGRKTSISYIDTRALIGFEAPLANLLTDFYDLLKSITSGFATYSYDLDGYRAEDLVKLDYLIANEKVGSLSQIVHRHEAESLARTTVKKLKDIIPRQNFKVAIQAAIGARIIAREDISAYRKDVTVGLYGGDVTRKKKVLDKQKKGKSRMKRFGKVDIPAEAFSVMLQKD